MDGVLDKIVAHIEDNLPNPSLVRRGIIKKFLGKEGLQKRFLPFTREVRWGNL